MSGPQDRLRSIAALLREDRLARLAAAEAACRVTSARLGGLVPAPPSPEVEPAAALRNAFAYALWVEERRARLARQLQGEERAREAALQAARLAFARAEAVAALVARQARPPRS